MSHQLDQSAVPNDEPGQPHTAAGTPLWKTIAPQDLQREQLKAGIIPERILEEIRILPLEEPLYADLRTALRTLIEPYATAEELTRFDETRIALADLSNCLGFALPNASPAICGLGRRAFDTTDPKAPQNLDALLGVIVHEFAHIVFQERYPHKGSSKPEEAAADIVAVQLLYERGLDPRAYLELLRSQEDPENLAIRKRASWDEIVDDHPVTATRLSYIAAEIARLEQLNHELRVAPTPLPDPNPFTPILAEMRHPSALEENLFSAKMAGLAAFVREAQSWNGARTQDVCNELRTIAKSDFGTAPNHDQMIHQFADTVLGKMFEFAQRMNRDMYQDDWVGQERAGEAYSNIQGLFSTYLELCNFKSPAGEEALPKGQLAEIALSAARAVNATSVEAQTDALAEVARRFLEIDFLTNTWSAQFATKFHWPVFPLPEHVGETVSWQNVLQEGIRRAASGDSSALAGLLLLGVEDPRIYPHLTPEWLFRFVERGGYISSGRSNSDEPWTGISTGAVSEALLKGNIRGEDFERRCAISVRNMVFDEHGVVTARAHDWRSYWDLLTEHIQQRNQALYRPDLFEQFEALDPAVLNDVEYTRGLVADIRAYYGPPAVLEGIECALTDPGRFRALNAAIMDTHEVQNAVIAAFEEAVRTAPDSEARAALFQTARSYFVNPTSLHIQRICRTSHELLDEGSTAKELEPETPALPPFLTYPLMESHGVYSRQEKIRLLNESMGNLPLKSERLLYREIFAHIFPGVPVPCTSWDELCSAVRELRMVLEEDIPTSGINESERTHLIHKCVEEPLEGYAELLVDVAELPRPTVQQVAALLSLTRSVPLADIDSEVSLRDLFLEILDEPLIFSANPCEAAEEWKTLCRAYSLMPEDRIEPTLEEILAMKSWETVTGEERCRAFASILEAGHIHSLTLNEGIIKRWCKAVRDCIGDDDSTADYQTRLDAFLPQIKTFSGEHQQYTARSMLAKELRLQQRCAAQCRGEGLLNEGFFSSPNALLAVGLDGLLEVVRDDRDVRDDVLDFLLTPVSRGSCREFLDKFEENLFIGICGLETTSERSQSRHEVERLTEVESLHRNFWSLRLEARALAARELLLPSGRETPEAYAEAYEVLFARICPKDDPAHEAARTFLRRYAENLPDYARPIFLGALMVAASPQTNPEQRIGRAIALVAGAMGPIENKVVQGAHSHHSTPELIRVDLAETKYLTAEPERWELFELIDEALPPNVRAHIRHVGDVIGAASFFISVKVELESGEDGKKGEEVVLQLLRPNVIDRAELGVKRLRRVAEELAAEDPAYQVMIELCDEAERSFRSEVNMAEAKLKAGAAAQMYSGEPHDVHGVPIPVTTCSLIELAGYGTAVGEDWRMVSFVDGELFIKLAKDPDAETRQLLRYAALGLAEVELGHAVSGGPMDDDWHGGNVIINAAGHPVRIDHGAITLAPPSDSELETVGAMLAKSLASVVAGDEDPALAFLSEMRRRQNQGEWVPPLSRRIEKSLLTLAEYERIFEPGDRAWLLQRVISRAHPSLVRGITLAA